MFVQNYLITHEFTKLCLRHCITALQNNMLDLNIFQNYISENESLENRQYLDFRGKQKIGGTWELGNWEKLCLYGKRDIRKCIENIWKVWKIGQLSIYAQFICTRENPLDIL